MQKKSKEYQNFENKIRDLLRDFQRNREWADIGNWITRAQPIIAANKFSQFPHKINMAKRLAQCLNINLPAGVHSGALTLYNTILKNYGNKSHLLPLMSIGLFPFFEYSSSTLKQDLLNIFQNHFINEHQCIQMIVSLMNTLLTGLNENNQELARKIYNLCDKISERYGRIWVDGAVWINILKSSKVRVAGFKYFMKSFKDRDKKLKKSIDENQQQLIEKEQIQQVKNQQRIINENSLANDSELELLIDLLKVKQLEDGHKVRFPNFSSLVVNALCASLHQTQPDNLACRSALDLMIFYLKLQESQFMTKRDTIQLLTTILKIVKLKEYSLTRRIYTYLFGQPDMQGNYQIDEKQRLYQTSMLLQSLQCLLKVNINADVNQNEGTLLIIQLLLKDHQKLGDIIIRPLAYKILEFLRKSTLSNKFMHQFYKKIIKNRSDIFIQACLSEILQKQNLSQSQRAHDTITTIQYFYLLNIDSSQSSHQSQIAKTIQGLLKYLDLTQCAHIKNSQQILQLCSRLLKSNDKPQQCLTQNSIKILDKLIQLKPINSIYAGLLIIHPCPKKESLLPYINETSLCLVSISNLLKIKPQQLDLDQRNSVFYAIFNLLNCHMWQEPAIQYIHKFKFLYPESYDKNINLVQPKQWLVYWRKMNGDISDGVIRMLKNLNNQNPLLKNISKKWIVNSQSIQGKILDCIYSHLKSPKDQKNQSNISNIELYQMLQNLFIILKGQLVTYFFLQQQKYLLPLISILYDSFETNDQQLKSQSLMMLQFLLERANTLEQKLIFLNLTLKKTVNALKKTFEEQQYLRQIQFLSYFKSVAQIFLSFKGHKAKITEIKTLIDTHQLFTTLSEGMKATKVGYVRTLYMELLQFLSETLSNISVDKDFLSKHLTIVFQKLFYMLRENDVTQLQQIIRGKTITVNRRKKSDMANYQKINNISDTQFNVEIKYAQVIQLWNMIKFLVNISIQNQIQGLPITKLLSLILQSFPFSYLKYNQLSTKIISEDYQTLQEQIRNVTGLKKQVLDIFEALWKNYQQQIINYLIEKGDPRVLIHASVDPNAVVKAIHKSKNCKQINNYNKQGNFSLPKSVLHYNTQILIIENQISYFLYLYIMYCNLTLLKQKKNSSFISVLSLLMRSLKQSWHIQTKLWVLEILYCIGVRMPFRQMHQQVTKTRQQFQDLLKDLLDELRHIIIKTKSFTHRNQIKTGIFNMFSKQQKQQSLYDFIKIYPPTIYQMNEEFVRKNKTKNSDHIFPIQDQMQYYLFSKASNQSNAAFTQYLSIVALKTFIKIYTKLLIFVFQQDINKIAPIIKDHLLSMLPLISDKSSKNQTYIENVTEFVQQIFNTASLKNQMIKMCRRSILDIYYADDFFKCTKKTLKHWKYIVDVCSDGQDLLGQLLQQKLFQGIFTRKAQQTRLKIKNFERVCFLIYAGRIDKYENRLRTVLESLNQVMKQQNPSPALLILILFCIRILLMRLSESTLNRIFRSIWPSLIALLIQIFTKEVFSKNSNLLLAGLKVIQLVHALQLEEFNIHKWIFIFDYFGIKIDGQTQQQQRKHENQEILTPFLFKPIMTKVLPQSHLKCTFVPQQLKDNQYEINKRKLIVKDSNVDAQDDLKSHGFILLQYMMDLNQKRVYTVKEEIQDIIEGDFISLDDYIFQVR